MFLRLKIILTYVIDVLLLKDASYDSIDRKYVRFFMLAITSFITYFLFYGLKELSIEQIDLIMGSLFSSTQWFIAGLIYLGGGLFSLYMSLVSVSLFNSLLAKY